MKYRSIKSNGLSVCRAIMVSMLLFCFSVSAYSQNRIIKGKVSDMRGEALVGVSVQVKGTQKGTATDAQGRFQLNLGAGQNTLLFRYIGFE